VRRRDAVSRPPNQYSLAMVAPSATLLVTTPLPRFFMSKWFARASHRAGIGLEELCRVARALVAGRGEDLGGGVRKVRLHSNHHRSIVLTGGGQYWVFEYLFAKQDRANIDAAELTQFRKLAACYRALTLEQVAALTTSNAWTEICDDEATQLQV